uniref:GLOBIN domain-containing protein n=1 Tax=Wuchereria bancrofti TaxID=6293 RepID=A0AAF5PTY6_WUCBA
MKCLCFGRNEIPVNVSDQYCKSNAKSANDEFNDSRIPLTRKQKFVLIKNWKGIERDVTTAGIEMFLKMLTENPEYYEFFNFRNIANTTKEKQASDERLSAHGAAVMKFIGKAISQIENADAFFMLLENNGKQHAHRGAFRPEMFWKMENPFLYSVKLILGERYTDNMDAIYKTVIQLILQRMEEACRTEAMKIRNKNVEI